MLSEAINFVFTKCESNFKRLGYLHEAIAINARYNRCQSAWAEHLFNSKACIRKVIPRVANNDTVVVLGAGAGHDIPLEALEANFKRIVLVDVVFLRTIRKRAKKNPQITLLEVDLTGLISAVLDQKINTNLKELVPNPPKDLLDDVDLVVSCNILSQLPINIRNRLTELGVDDNSPELDHLCRSIILSHLEWLSNSQAEVLLITDLERHLIPEEETEQGIIRDNALYDVKILNKGQQWLWDIAPCPEIDKSYSLKHLVGSYHLSKSDSFQTSKPEANQVPVIS